MRVIVDRNQCESNAFCIRAAPAVFEVDDDDELVILNETPDESQRQAVMSAVRQCPRQAISVQD